jgi:hypothetical protein
MRACSIPKSSLLHETASRCRSETSWCTSSESLINSVYQSRLEQTLSSGCSPSNLLILSRPTHRCSHNMSAFNAYQNIAYRFLSPAKISSAIDISVTADQCVFTRLFFLFRGVSEEDMGNFITAGEKEANQYNWREVIGWSEFSKDLSHFRVLEISTMEL